MLGMVITGNARLPRSINAHRWQKPPTPVGLSISECLACNVEWDSDKDLTAIAQTFHLGLNQNSSCWMLQAGLNALIP